MFCLLIQKKCVCVFAQAREFVFFHLPKKSLHFPLLPQPRLITIKGPLASGNLWLREIDVSVFTQAGDVGMSNSCPKTSLFLVFGAKAI